MELEHRKRTGAYYTPDHVARRLVQWALSGKRDRLLDPACGDGAFLAYHKLAVGVEQNASEASTARGRAPWALVHEGDFFAWASATKERFECSAGNPPFIRYQNFNGETRKHALEYCSQLGADFSALTSSWAPFLVAACSLLKPGGRIAYVVPAELGHAPYAQPLLQYLASNFADVRVIAVRTKIFPQLSEDAWILYADGFGRETGTFLFSTHENFPDAAAPPGSGAVISATELAQWRWRLRSFLVSADVRSRYHAVLDDKDTVRLGDIARVGIGYVSGDNAFFHLRPSEADRMKVPSSLLLPSVRNGRALPPDAVRHDTVQGWISEDAPVLLLRLQKEDPLPVSVRKYLNSDRARQARSSYKCRSRDPWYSVPDVNVPDAFLSYMSSTAPALIPNLAGVTCTNSVHYVRFAPGVAVTDLVNAWRQPFTQLSAEIEGHPLGGGMLKVEPREAQRIAIPMKSKWTSTDQAIVRQGLSTLRAWRHLDA